MTTAKNSRKPPQPAVETHANEGYNTIVPKSGKGEPPEFFDTFPTPEQLKEYDSVVDGGANRILDMFAHAAAGERQYRLAALIAWTVATVVCFLAVLAFAIYCIYIGYNHTGLAAAALAVVGATLSFWRYFRRDCRRPKY